jgi:dienelactone hydrolase
MALEFDSGGKKIPYELFLPTASGKRPAIMVAYGTHGMTEPFGTDIRSYAGYLADRGYVALIPHYFVRTGTTPGPTALVAVA